MEVWKRREGTWVFMRVEIADGMMAFCYLIRFGSNEGLGYVRSVAGDMIVLEDLEIEIWGMWELGVVEG